MAGADAQILPAAALESSADVGQNWLWRLVAAVGVTLLLVTSTARLTVLDQGFDARAIAAAQGYERLYNEVLPSPTVQEAINNAFAGLPLDPTYLTANVRLLLPPDVLEQVVTRLLGNYVEVLTGKRKAVDAGAVLQPVADHLVRLLRDLLPGALAATPRLTTQSIAAFSTAFQQWLEGVQRGARPLALPSVALHAPVDAQVARILTSGLTAAERAALEVALEPLLRSGDLTGALALVLPAYLDERAVDDLSTQVAQATQLVAGPLPAELLGSSFRGSAVLPLGLRWLTVLGGVLIAVCAARLFVRRRKRVLPELALTLALAAVAALTSGWVLARVLVDPLQEASQQEALRPVYRELIADVDNQLRAGVGHTYLALVGLVGVVAFGCGLLARIRAARGGRRQQWWAGLSTAVLLSAGLIVPLDSGASVRTCNGSQRLCDHHYDQVSYLTAHNAMASSSRGVVNANQDLSLTGQLDNGVRALMLDLHYWTTPTELRQFLSDLEPATRAAWAPLLRPLAPREGVWLCHVVCQLGADPAVQQLRAVRDWLREHRDAVVTLIVEDHVSEADLRATLDDADLTSMLTTPPTGGAPWPTLGQMVGSGNRLVVFSEKTSPAQGPVRNFYDYAAETPFETTSPALLSCDRGRGPATATLFLLNNWISTPAPSRAVAKAVNARRTVLDRAARCQEQRGMRPSFVAVDFAQTGQSLAAVDELNREIPASGLTR